MSVLFGFTKYLLELIEKEKPTHIAVSFDPPGGTFRHEMFPDYKGTRAETPQLVIDSLDPLIELCGALRIPVLMVKGFEADDVIPVVYYIYDKLQKGGNQIQYASAAAVILFVIIMLITLVQMQVSKKKVVY